MTAICTYLCHIERRSPVDCFSDVFRDACVLSKMPIVWACLVDAWLICMSSACAIWLTTSDLNCDPLSVILTLGRYQCLVIASMIHRATVFAVISCVG